LERLNDIATSQDERGDVATTVSEAHLLKSLELALELLHRAGTAELHWSRGSGNRDGGRSSRSRSRSRSGDDGGDGSRLRDDDGSGSRMGSGSGMRSGSGYWSRASGLLLFLRSLLLLAALLLGLLPLFAHLLLELAALVLELTLEVLQGLAIREVNIDVNLLLRVGVSFERGKESLVRVELADIVEIRVVLDVLNIAPAGSDSLLEVLNGLLLLVAEQRLNAGKVVERGDTVEGAGVRLLLEELASLEQSFTRLGLHELHSLLVETEPLLTAHPGIGIVLGTSAVGMEIE